MRTKKICNKCKKEIDCTYFNKYGGCSPFYIKDLANGKKEYRHISKCFTRKESRQIKNKLEIDICNIISQLDGYLVDNHKKVCTKTNLLPLYKLIEKRFLDKRLSK